MLQCGYLANIRHRDEVEGSEPSEDGVSTQLRIISLTDRTLRYERRDIGSTVSSVDSVGAKRVPPARSTLYGLLAVYTATIII